MSNAKEQVGRLETLLDRVRSRARRGQAAPAATAAAATPAASAASTTTSAAAHVAAVQAETPSQSDLAVPVTRGTTPPAASASTHPSEGPASRHQTAPPPASAAPSSMAASSSIELGADDVIEAVSQAKPQASAPPPAVRPPSLPPRAPSVVPSAPPPSDAPGSVDVDVDNTSAPMRAELPSIEVEHGEAEDAPAPSSSRRPKSERAQPYEEEAARPVTTPPESGRQVSGSAFPTAAHAESGKRASVPAVSFGSEPPTNEIARGHAAEGAPATFVGSPRRAASTFGELLDAALSL